MNEPKTHLHCSTCHSNWTRFEFQRDCPECGNGALQIPCPTCSGTCGAMWNRAVLDSNDTRVAHWIGACYHLTDRYAEPNNPPRATKRYLFCFGYATPEQLRANRKFDDDAESSSQVFVDAPSKREAANLGRAYADLFVLKQFDTSIADARSGAYIWSEAGYSHWLEEDLQELDRAAQQKVPALAAADQLIHLLAE